MLLTSDQVRCNPPPLLLSRIAWCSSCQCIVRILHFSVTNWQSKLISMSLFTLSFCKTSEFSPMNLMIHVRAAVVVSWPATSRVRILSFNCKSVSLLESSSSCSGASLLCFLRSVCRKSWWISVPARLLEIIESNIEYIRSRACTNKMVYSFK